MSITICNKLALDVQNGDQSAVLALWRAMSNTTSAVVRRYGGTASVSSEDLLQQAYFALLEAVAAYDSTRGDFKNIFIYCVKKACGRALNLHRRHVEETCSLDQPVNEDGSTTLGEMIEDESLVPAQELLEHSELGDALRVALADLPERWRVVIEERYIYGHTLMAAGERLGCSYQNAARLEAQALKRLRGNKELTRLYRVM